MIIKREFDPNEGFNIGAAMKSKYFLGAEVVMDETDETLEVHIDTSKYTPCYYRTAAMEQSLYNFMIKKVILTFEIDEGFDTSGYIEFDEPKDIEYLKSLQDGHYIVKFIRPHGMEASVEILNKFKQGSSMGGSFLFDMKEILVLSITRLHK